MGFYDYLWCTVALVSVYIVYKLIDRLVRIPSVENISDRYIVLTGCDTGFGHLAARRLDKRGCHVFAGCLTEAGQKDLIRHCSSRLKVFELDVSNHDSVLKAYEFVKSKLPNGKGLWGLLNNAGVLGRCGPNEWLNLDDYKQVMAVNLLGLVDVTMTFLPLIKKGRGRIVNTASVFGRFTLGGCAPYCISKYGVEAFTDGMRRSLRAFGCKALLIEPGCHKTPITSKQNVDRLFVEAWNHASDEAKAEFGEEYFQYHAKTVFERYDTFCSGRVEDVVDAYEHALLGLYPRARYVVGADAKFLWLPLQWMPEWLGDYILWLLERLDKKNPGPAALKKRN